MGFKTIKHFPSFIIKQPCIPEYDVAGTVVDVGKAVTQWNIGDRVYGTIPTTDLLRTGCGALAEYTLVKEQNMCIALIRPTVDSQTHQAGFP